jgi:histidinol-phosphate aminotransferase
VTWANFVYCDIGQDAEEFSNRMASEGVLIRELDAWGAPHHIRVSIGTPEQNQAFLAAFQKLTTRA